MAVFYLNVPLLFWMTVGFYVLKSVLEIWAWTKVPAKERQEYRTPGGLMNKNHVLPVWSEWLFLLIGFFGLLLWVR